MANIITRHIPNSITCCNLISGCMATGAAFYGNYGWAFLLIVIGAVFDFFDGMSARLLGVSSPIGKELDSLADVVTFGVAPSAMIFHLFHFVDYPAFIRREVRLSAIGLFWPTLRRKFAAYDVINLHGPVPTMSEVVFLLRSTLPRAQQPTIVYTHHSDLAIAAVRLGCPRQGMANITPPSGSARWRRWRSGGRPRRAGRSRRGPGRSRRPAPPAGW